MEKLKKATKRIAAVGVATALVSSTVFGAGLSNYPTNFVKNESFDGQIVVGSTADVMDTTSATSIIDDLQAEFSGESEKVKITYKEESEGGDKVNAIDDRDTLNFGTDNTEFDDIIETLDLDMTSILDDNDLDNNDYSQELVMGTDNVEFNYRLFDEVDKKEATDGLYFGNGATFAKYTLDFGTALDSSERDASVGETLTIMDNEFKVIDISENEMTLIGGANKISLGEGEERTVEIDGENYDVSILSVADDKALLTVNGVTKSIDELDVEDVGGVSVAVTDLVSSSRDAVKGYAEFVIGGQKIEIEDNENIKINDEDLDDAYPDYEITADWDSTLLTVNYKIDDETLLEEGDYLEDVLFNTFTLSYDGINDVDYSELEINSDSDSIDFSGNLYNGDAIPAEFMLSVDDESETANNDFQLGANDERIFFSGSELGNANNLDGSMEDVATDGTKEVTTIEFTAAATTDGDITISLDDGTGTLVGHTVTLESGDSVADVADKVAPVINALSGYSAVSDGTDTVTVTAIDAGDKEDAEFDDTDTTGFTGAVTVTSDGNSDATELEFDLNSTTLDIKDQLFFTQETDPEEMHLYQVTSHNDDDEDSEISFEDLIGGFTYDDRNADDLESDLESNTFSDDGATNVTVTLADLSEDNTEDRGRHAQLYLENEMIMDFETAEDDDEIDFLYSTDADADEDSTLDNVITLGYEQDDGNADTDPIKLEVSGTHVGDSFEVEEDSDLEMFVDAYGTRTTIDTGDYDMVRIEVPDEEVYGEISFNFGEVGSSSTSSVTVDKDQVEDKKAELEAD
ncbi:MAG: hypothetical protein ACOC16_03635, partial [Nanoarchaeota archaeon]